MIKVLIVDDNELSRDMLRESLQDEEDIVIVDIASDGMDAALKIEELRPDIVLVDLVMPRLDGIGLVKKIKDEMENEAPSFIMISGVSDEIAIKRAFSNGISYYIIKPYNTEELVALIRELGNYVNQENDSIIINTDNKTNNKTNNKKTKLKKILELLNAYGISGRLKGYGYIVKAVEIALEEENISNAMTKHLYYTLSKEFDTSYGSIERNIRYAIQKGFDKASSNLPEELNSLKERRHKNFEFIAAIASYILAE